MSDYEPFPGTRDGYDTSRGPKRWERAVWHARQRPNSQQAQLLQRRVTHAFKVQAELGRFGTFQRFAYVWRPSTDTTLTRDHGLCSAFCASMDLGLTEGDVNLSTLVGDSLMGGLDRSTLKRALRCFVCGGRISADEVQPLFEEKFALYNVPELAKAVRDTKRRGTRA